MKLLTKQFNYTKTTKNALRFDVDGDPSGWAPYEKSFYLSLGEWRRWCEANGHDADDTPLYLSMTIEVISEDIVPATGRKDPVEKPTSME
jgi:hypothetical protein